MPLTTDRLAPRRCSRATLAALAVKCARYPCYADTHGAQHALGVVARDSRFGHARRAIRVQPGQQDGRFDLRARHRHLVMNAMQCMPHEFVEAAFRPSLSIAAPMAVSGLMMRPIGRPFSDSSPLRTLSKGCPQSKPAINRIAVPELPRSRSRQVPCRPFKPTPSMTISVALGCSMRTPSARIAASVARQSSPARNPDTSVRPSAILPSISAR